MIRDAWNRLYLRWRYPRLPRIFTHVTPTEKRTLLELADAQEGATFVEIGSYLGASAACIAEGIARRRPPGAARLYCVDTWANEGMSEGPRDTFAEFKQNTAAYQPYIVPLRGRSADQASAVGPVDFVFFDGDHSPAGVTADLDAWLPKLAPSGLVIFHDISWCEGVARGVAERVQPRAQRWGRLPNLYWAWL